MQHEVEDSDGENFQNNPHRHHAALDKTNLEGKYYFGFEFLSDDAPPDTDAPTLAEAIRGLGLLLEKEKGPVKALVIDHIEKMPTEN